MQIKEFNALALEEQIHALPPGNTRMEALLDAIHQADEANATKWRLMFRYDYASEATFHDDPPKAMPVAVEFGSIFEENPEALGEDGAELYIMIMQMAIDPIVHLPQISRETWEKLMQEYDKLVKKYHLGLRTYYWQICQFMQYIDMERAYAFFQKFWKTGRDALSDCRACERSYAVRMCLLTGDRKEADQYAKPLEQGRIRFCPDTPQLMWLAYLEDALNRRDYNEAAPRSMALFRKGVRDKSDLSYIGAVLRCWAFTNLERVPEILEKYLGWTLGMWDQKKRYDFFKGAWIGCEMLARQAPSIPLQLPIAFPIYQKDGVYNPSALAQWFYQEASQIAKQFDMRNGSTYFMHNLEIAGQAL